MKPNIRNVHQCPYCLRGRGVIAIDLAKVLAQRPDPPQPVFTPRPPITGDPKVDMLAELEYMEEINTTEHHTINLEEPDGIFIFDPDASAEGPCRHTIYLYPEVEAVYHESLASEPSRWEYGGIWNHPWFAEHDHDEYAREGMWDLIEWLPRRPPDLRPTQPHVVRKFSRSWKSRRGRWNIWVEPIVVLALEPVAFLEELRHSVKQCSPQLQEPQRPHRGTAGNDQEKTGETPVQGIPPED